MNANNQANSLRLIKKYPGRRLYDTKDSKYIAFSGVKKLIQVGVELQIIEVKTGIDVTRNILLQIILDQESDIDPEFSVETLKSIIRFYGHSMQSIMGIYLERTLSYFLPLHAKARESTENILDATLNQAKDMCVEMQEKFIPSNSNSSRNKK